MKSVEETIHFCHARPLCKVPVPPRLLFCKPHWAMVPADMKTVHFANYRKRRRSKTDYLEFLKSLEACVDYVKASLESMNESP